MTDVIICQFEKGYNDLVDLYEQDRLDELDKAACTMLGEPAITRYYRIKTLVLLGSIRGDYAQALECYYEAETLWRITRRWHPEGGCDPAVDDALNDCKEDLDSLKQALDHDGDDEDVDMEDELENRDPAHHDDVEMQRGLAEAECETFSDDEEDHGEGEKLSETDSRDDTARTEKGDEKDGEVEQGTSKINVS